MMQEIAACSTTVMPATLYSSLRSRSGSVNTARGRGNEYNCRRRNHNHDQNTRQGNNAWWLRSSADASNIPSNPPQKNRIRTPSSEHLFASSRRSAGKSGATVEPGLRTVRQSENTYSRRRLEFTGMHVLVTLEQERDLRSNNKKHRQRRSSFYDLGRDEFESDTCCSTETEDSIVAHKRRLASKRQNKIRLPTKTARRGGTIPVQTHVEHSAVCAE